MSKKFLIKVEGNMLGMEGTEGPRVGVFCHSPQSFIDVARVEHLVATWAGDHGCMNLYRDDSGELRGYLARYQISQYSFVASEVLDPYEMTAPLLVWLKKALRWCDRGGKVPTLADAPAAPTTANTDQLSIQTEGEES